MARTGVLAAAGAALLVAAAGTAFVLAPAPRPLESGDSAAAAGAQAGGARFLAAPGAPAAASQGGGGLAAAGLACGALAVAAALAAARRRGGAPATDGLTARERLAARHAQTGEGPAPEEVDAQVDEFAEGLADWARQAVGTTCAVLVTFGAATEVQAFPIYAQQNYKNPIDATGRLACANCHLGSKKAHLRAPFSVYPDTVFRTLIDIPADYEYKKQLLGTGERGDMQVGAVIVMPKGFKLAPKDRLPKILKKQMKGLAWSAYSKEKPNIIVAGPATNKYNVMVAPILSPDPAAEKKPGDVGSLGAGWGRCEFNLGANRGRGQVYPDGTKSNVNMFASPATGTITAIEDVPPKEGEKQVARPAKKVTITKEDGKTASDTVGAGATWVVSLGDKVKKDQPLTTNPNLGGFGQSDKDVVLQDPRREQVYTATAFTLFLTQLSFVLKKKQFEKVQLAEGF